MLNKLLAGIIGVSAATFVFNTLDYLDILPPWLFGLLLFSIQPLAYLLAPLTFYYVSLMCGKKPKIHHPLFILTGLVILYNFYTCYAFIILDTNAKQIYVEDIRNNNYPMGIAIITGIFFILQQIYFTVAAYDVVKFKKKLAAIFSTNNQLKIKFTQRFVILMWTLNISVLILYLSIPQRIVEFYILPLVVFIINGFIIYYAIEYKVIFTENSYKNFLKDLNRINNLSSSKIENSSKKDELTIEKIETFLIENKSYLNLEYSLFDLSKELNLSYADVSCLINKKMNKNFSTLINELRIEESKSILKEKFDNLTIDAIAELSGFKSRSAFYRAFKAHTGTTPSKYLKS